MDWDTLIEVLSETIKDDNLRSEVYEKIMKAGYLAEAEDSLGQDDIFDDTWHVVFTDNKTNHEEYDEEIEDDNWGDEEDE